jgi:cysteine desulfurase
LGRSLYTVLNVGFRKVINQRCLLLNLDINNICASGGSACSSGADVGSHVISAIHHDPEKVAVRFSFCKHNTREEIDIVVAKLKELV